MTIAQPHMNSIVVRTVKPIQWAQVVRQFTDASYLLTGAYIDSTSHLRNLEPEFIVIEDETRLIAAAALRIKRLPVIGGGIAYLRGGPLVRQLRQHPEECERRLHIALHAMTDLYCDRHHLNLRIVGAIGASQWCDRQNIAFEACGFLPTNTAQAYRTIVLDISRPLDSLRATLRRNWRNHLKQAERRNITIERGCDRRMFDTFLTLYDETSNRKGFAVNLDARFYRDLHERLYPHERMTVHLAFENGSCTAGIVTTAIGDTATYLLGATTRNGMRNQSSYLLHWRAIENMRTAGIQYYDLGGVNAGVNPGVAKFKQGFGGEYCCAPGPFEIPGTGVTGRIVHAAESIYRKLVG